MSEGGSVPVCVHMTSSSAASTLGTEVVVTVSTRNGTGIDILP